ncbi:MAG TPA: hypothetical protein DCX06_10965 [Opitutae bacterium]|nr:hypothetical protein [Opitutae bacterium]
MPALQQQPLTPLHFMRILFLIFFSAVSLFADTASDLVAVDALGSLTTAPTVYNVDTSSGTHNSSSIVATLNPGDHKTIFFDSINYEGNPTRVYAWIDIPSGISNINKAPAVVLVHGGGGTAFELWASLWSSRGYVAISIDTEGNSINNSGNRTRHNMAGPNRPGVYAESGTAIEDQFMYHATAATVLANSLLRSLPFVDDTKVGVHGLSWGGVITSTTIGVDQRFAFAIPTYGCGHSWDAVGNWESSLINNIQYREVWDPMIRLHRATMPIMWLSWPQDSTFNIDTQANSYNAAPGTELVSLVPNMNHSHGSTWHRADSYEFANSIVNTGSSWCTQESLSLVGDQITVEFASTRTLTGATLFYTNEMGRTDTMAWPNISVDSFAETAPGSGVWQVTATLPSDANAWYVNVTANSLTTGHLRGETIYASSRLQEVVQIETPGIEEFGLKAGDTSAVKDVSVDFTAIYNLEISSMQLISESHPGAFIPNISYYPYSLTNDSPFEVNFDNTIAGLAVGESATATLRLTWLGLDNQPNLLDIPLVATVYTPQIVVYNTSSNWSSQSPTIADHVIIRDGAVVTLDEDVEISNLTVGQDGTVGTLSIMNPNDFTVAEDMIVTTGSLVSIANGNFDYFNTAFDLAGEIQVSGGRLNLDGTNVDGAGKLAISGGEVVFTAAFSVDIADIEISGGSLNFNGSGSTTHTRLGDQGTSRLTIIGSTPTISVGRLQMQTYVNDPRINFVLDASGVSEVYANAFMNLPKLSIHVDASAYEGGVDSITLLRSGNLATLGDLSRHTATGFAAKGFATQFTQSQADDTVKMVLTKNAYGNWADAESLPSNTYHATLDTDLDGRNNLMEFILGSDPQASETNEVPVSPLTPSNLVFSFSRNANASGMTSQIFQYSSNLSNWTDVIIDGANPDITITPTAGSREDIEITISPSAPVDGKLFGRLSATIDD